MSLQGPAAHYRSIAEEMKAVMEALEQQLSYSQCAERGLVDHLLFEASQQRSAACLDCLALEAGLRIGWLTSKDIPTCRV